MKVLLLGATGIVGRRVATELIRTGALERLVLAARDEAALESLAGLLRGSTEVTIDAFDLLAEGAAAHLRGHDVVVSCAGPGYLLEERCVDAAIEAGVDYVSLNDDDAPARAIAGRHDEARDRGVTIVSGCGVAPGLSNLLVALASKKLERIQEVEVSVGASSADPAGPAADLHFVKMFEPGGPREDKKARSPHPVYFPDPVGWIETFGCEHPEEIAIRDAHPSLEAFRFRIGLGEKAVMDTVRAGAAAGLASTERRRRSWLRAARPLRPLLEAISPGSKGWTALRVDVRGTSAQRRMTISYGVVDRLVNLASIPLVLCALSLPTGGRGVIAPDGLADPADMLSSVAQRGVRFAELEPHTL